MPNQFIAYNKSTNLFRVEGLKKYAGNSNETVNDATVTLEKILDNQSVDVLGGAQTLSYIAGSLGDYELAYTVNLTSENKYTAEIKVVSGTLQHTVYPPLVIKDDID